MSLFAKLQRGLDRLVVLLYSEPVPIADYPFAPSDVARYDQHHLSAADPARPDSTALLDDHTWDDMLLASYSAKLARGTSILGQQELHRRLRCATSPGESPERVRALLDDPARRERLEQACSGLRRVDREVAETLFGPAAPASPRWAGRLHWLPLAFLGSLIAAVLTSWGILWLAAGACWLALMMIQVRYHEAADQWSRILATLQQMLRAHSLLAGLAGPVDGSSTGTGDPLAQQFIADRAQAGKLNRAISGSALGRLPGAREYADWLWLKNIRHYFASRDKVIEQLGFLRGSFSRIAQLEADLALARHLAGVPAYCWAEDSRGQDAADAALSLEQVVHPLLDGAAPLSFALGGQGAFISGQNGIGKSTLLRTVGLNLICARAFGFCYAARAVTPLLPVYSSMQSEDALDSGESLYIAELRRAQELLALAARGPGLFVIDEIFRGTNHLESISAAAAVLHTLASAGRVIVSSHNLVLASLLADCLAPWCVSAPGGDRSRLQLSAGVLDETNGIALLGSRGFGAAIENKAARVFDWLSDYMAHPADSAGVVDGSRDRASIALLN